MIHKNVRIGKQPIIQEDVVIGLPSKEFLQTDDSQWPETSIGNNAIIRAGTKIYCSVCIGNDFQTGHNVMIREGIQIGNNVLVGTGSVIDNATQIGSNVSIQSMVYIPTNTTIEDEVFIGPNVVMTNDKYPARQQAKLVGPIIHKGATIGAHATILAGIEIGEGAFIAAGSIITKNIPAWTLAIGCPAQVKELPEDLKKNNMI